MASKSFSQVLTEARLLASGIRKNAEQLTKRGIDIERADEVEALLKSVESLDNEQESLKSRLKLVSEELRVKTEELKTGVAKDFRIIKTDFPQEQWLEFGILAKH
jgi:uncharacterized DUF497 family protein